MRTDLSSKHWHDWLVLYQASLGLTDMAAELTPHACFWQERRNPAAQAAGLSSWE
jgi:hypothetical protein